MANERKDYFFESKFICGCRQRIAPQKLLSASYKTFCGDCEVRKSRYSKNVTTKMYENEMEIAHYKSLFYKTDMYDCKSYGRLPVRIVKYFDPSIAEDVMMLAEVTYDQDDYLQSIKTIKDSNFLDNLRMPYFDLSVMANQDAYNNLTNLLFEDNYLEQVSTILQQMGEYIEIDSAENMLIQPILLYDAVFSTSFMYPNYVKNAEFYPVDRMIIDLNKFIYLNRIKQRFDICIT